MNNRATRVGVLIWSCCVLFSTAFAAGMDGQVLTHIGQIRALSRDQISSNPPVLVEAVVTHYTPARSHLWVQEGADGVRIITEKQRFPVNAGDRVRVSGRIKILDNWGAIDPDRVEVIGKGRLPEPPMRNALELSKFTDENRFVQAEGHVLQVDEQPTRWLAELEEGSSRFWLELPRSTNSHLPPLIDAMVRAPGVCEILPYRGGERLYSTLLVQNLSELTILRPGRAMISVNLEEIPVQEIAAVLRRQGSSRSNSLVHFRGTVLDQRLGEYLVIADDTATVLAETPQLIAVSPQQKVDVWGETAWDGPHLSLKRASFSILVSPPASASINVLTNRPAVLPVLTNALQVRNLSPEMAAWRYPVHLRAVVTFYHPQRGYKFYVQDESSGIYVMPRAGYDLKTGDLVDLRGVSDPGAFAPRVEPTAIKVIGTVPLPEPAHATLYQLATGQYNGQWMEERGVVRSQSFDGGLLTLKLNDASGTFVVNIITPTIPTNLLDAVIVVRGVCSTSANERRQITGSALWTPSMDYARIEEPGVADPLALPEKTILSLSQFRPSQTLPRRAKVAGIVTLSQSAQSLFLQDTNDGIQVLTYSTNIVRPGDRVVAAGYPDMGDYGVVLRDAVLRVIGHEPLPVPRPMKPGKAVDPDSHGMWVQVDAMLTESRMVGNVEVLTLQSPDGIFEAHCLSPGGRPIPPIGSQLRLTGVYRVLADETRTPISFQLLIPSNENVVVLDQPSWWTYKHTLTVIGGMTLIIASTALWILMLRRKVQDQTASLQQSERKFRSLIEQSLVGVYIIQNGRFVYVNPRMGEIFGYKDSEILGLDEVSKVVWEEDRPLVQENIRRRIDGEMTTVHYSFRGRRKDGGRVDLEALGSRTDYNGSPAILGTLLDITERKRAADQLFQSQQMLRTVLDTIPTRVFWKDQNSVYVGCNKALARDCGYNDPSELVGKTDFDTTSAATADLYRADDQRVIESGEGRLNFEEPQVKADGTVGWLRTSKVPLRDKNGRVIGVLGTYEDISERKRAEAALGEASTLLETLLENSPDCIYFKDRESRFVRFSKAFAKLFHLPDSASLQGKTDFDFFSEEHARPAFEDEQEIIRSGNPLVGKLEKETHPDGRITWALTTKLPWRDKAGNIIGTFGISKDVTAIKDAEAKLAYERDLFRTLLDNFPDAIYFKDLESRFVRLSRSKAEKSLAIVLGQFHLDHPEAAPGDLPSHLTSAEKFAEWLTGKSDADTFTAERAQSAYQDEQEIIRTGRPILAKIERTPQFDGQITWCMTTKMAWRNTAGKIIGTFGVSKDITALKEAEAELEATHQRLLETSRLAGMAEVATDVLHNVGNVLNSVNVSCSVVMDRLKESKLGGLARLSALVESNKGRLADFLLNDPQGRGVPAYLAALADYSTEEHATLLRELEQLRNNIDHIKQIVTMQQSYAKVAGVVECVAVPQLVEDALNVNSAGLDRHGVQVRKEIETTQAIFTEKHKILQILVNLISNAKYAMHDSERPDKLMTIRVGGDGDGHIRIQVTDNGVGIPRENLTRIFAHGFTTRSNGHGFGLHSSALAIKEIGGSLHAHSDGPGQGATFTLLLPLNAPKRSE